MLFGGDTQFPGVALKRLGELLKTDEVKKVASEFARLRGLMSLVEGSNLEQHAALAAITNGECE